MDAFFLCFIPLFVAMDPAGIMPIFLGLTQSLPRRDRQRVLVHSLLTAFAVSLAFLFGGPEIFRFLGISIADFQIAGGIVLLVIAVMDLTHRTKEERRPDRSVGIVPIGVPLIMGPAALTALAMLSGGFGKGLVTLALAVNLVIMALALVYAGSVEQIFGTNGMKALSKIISLFLAAIAVMFIRVGL